MRGDMTSEEYIMTLMQTIGSMDSSVRSLRDELALLREKDADHNVERKRLMALIEAKEQDKQRLSEQMAQLFRQSRRADKSPGRQVSSARQPEPG